MFGALMSSMVIFVQEALPVIPLPQKLAKSAHVQK